jgi:hypothetical protein
MTVVLEVTDKIKTGLTPFYWRLFPKYERHVFGISTWRRFTWLCLYLEITNKHMEKQDWSDEEVVRQMRSLEQEVESLPKPVVKKIGRKRG